MLGVLGQLEFLAPSPIGGKRVGDCWLPDTRPGISCLLHSARHDNGHQPPRPGHTFARIGHFAGLAALAWPSHGHVACISLIYEYSTCIPATSSVPHAATTHTSGALHAPVGTGK